MARDGYGVLRGRVRDSRATSSLHSVTIEAKRASYSVSLDVGSRKGSELLYLVDLDYGHPVLGRIAGVSPGFTEDVGLDYLRDRPFDGWRMRPVPIGVARETNDLALWLEDVLGRARRDPDAEAFALGRLNRATRALRDVHMNQGNDPAGPHANGIHRDGALFVRFPAADRWVAVFLAFRSQTFGTDEAGAPVGAPRSHRRGPKRPPMAPVGVSLSPIDVPAARPPDPGESFVATRIPEPTRRPLRAYAFDPSRGRLLGNEMRLDVRYRKLLPGPVEVDDASDRIAVVDYDGAADCYYEPVDLDDPKVMLSNGLWPTESDPRFHQQMVYAVASDTIEQFEAALGRRIHWRRAARSGAQDPSDADIHTLTLHPHAMREPNAYYSPRARGILFGYFAADRQSTASLPDQPVFTCLSHDVIVHEVTHAIVDGVRGYFLERTHRDVAAFHEGFADLAALFRHFSHREVLLDTLQRTGGRLYGYQLRPDATTDAGAAPDVGRPRKMSDAAFTAQIAKSNPLIELAQQFGDATGLRHALRSALGTRPTPIPYKTVDEPHARGSILVAAVFDAFFSIYVARTTDLFRIYRAGGGHDDAVDLPGPLANGLCDEATRTAREFFSICVRALDYCPPVDITFGEFLRAMITAEVDRDPDDAEGIREALMQAFRLRGILPDGARFFSEEALAWTRGDDLGLPKISGLHFGEPNGLGPSDRARIAPVLRGWADDADVRARLGLDASVPVDVASFHPVYRAHADGSLQRDMVVQVVQTRDVAVETGSKTTYPFRAGATMLIDGDASSATVRWVVTKPMWKPGRDVLPEARERHDRQRAFVSQLGRRGTIRPEHLRVDFGLVHRGI